MGEPSTLMLQTSCAVEWSGCSRTSASTSSHCVLPIDPNHSTMMVSTFSQSLFSPGLYSGSTNLVETSGPRSDGTKVSRSFFNSYEGEFVSIDSPVVIKFYRPRAAELLPRSSACATSAFEDVLPTAYRVAGLTAFVAR